MENILFNNSITDSSILGAAPQFSKEQKENILANIFEQLLLFDRVVISTDRNNYALAYLISWLGIDTVERLVKSNYLNFSVKSAVIFTGVNHQNDDGSLDEEVIYSQPPIVGAALGDEETDPETNVVRALSHFGIDKKIRNRLIKTIVPKYIKTDNMSLGNDITKIILDAYSNNNLSKLGLPFNKDPYDLNPDERDKLLNLSHSILEAATIAKNGFKSYNNYGHLQIAETNFENIGKAYNVSSNVSELLRIENTINLKEIYIQNKFNVSDIFKLRHLNSAKYFRKWINTVGENANSLEVTEAYLAEISNNKKFFNTTKGRIIKNTLLYGATSGLGGLIAGPAGMIAGGIAKPFVEPAIDYGFGLLEEFVLSGIFEGKNPKIFIDQYKKEVKK